MADDERALTKAEPKALSERDQGVMIVSGAVGLGIGTVVAIAASWASLAAFFTALNTLATVIMAGAAIAAFGLWKAQLRGQTEHEAATTARRAAHALAMEASISAHTLPKLWPLMERISDPNLRAQRMKSPMEGVIAARDALQSAELDLLAAGYGEKGISHMYEFWLFIDEWLETVEALARRVPPPEKRRGLDMAAVVRGDETNHDRDVFLRVLQELVSDVVSDTRSQPAA
jgi:hypothetical protein